MYTSSMHSSSSEYTIRGVSNTTGPSACATTDMGLPGASLQWRSCFGFWAHRSRGAHRWHLGGGVVRPARMQWCSYDSHKSSCEGERWEDAQASKGQRILTSSQRHCSFRLEEWGSGEGEDGIGEGYSSTKNAGCNSVKRSGVRSGRGYNAGRQGNWEGRQVWLQQSQIKLWGER